MKNIMIQATTSSAGKSLICTGLCRIFKSQGYRVYPFKSQNMSSNYYETKEGEKISRAQSMQAIAAGIEPHKDMNPILLQPTSHSGSKVILEGREWDHMEARDYFKLKNSLKTMIEDIYRKIERENEIIVIEGAGSPAEINLKENDIVNMGMAEIADAPVLLVADIDRGGVFASLYGTIMLLTEEERKRVKGLIINKFRGDQSLLDSGVLMIEELLDIPVIGIIPFIPLKLEEAETDEELDRELNKLAKRLEENMDIDFIYNLIGIS